jgi:lysophospholipase L1-like esterase
MAEAEILVGPAKAQMVRAGEPTLTAWSLTPSNMYRFGLAKGRLLGDNEDFSILMIGDSTTVGQGGIVGAQVTASLTSGSPTMTAADLRGDPLEVGMLVSGTGIPAGATISALGTGTGGIGTYTMSANATATGASVAVSATGPFATSGARRYSVPWLLAKYLTARGLSACTDAVFGTNNVGATGGGAAARYADYNRAITPGNWNADANYSVGGPMWTNAALDTSVLSITATQAFDSVEVYYARNSNTPDMEVSIGGGAYTTLTGATGGVQVISRVVIASGAAPAIQSVNLRRKAGGATGNIRVVGVAFHNSQAPRINIINLGWNGSTTFDHVAADNAWSPINALPILAAGANVKLAIINLGLNDTWPSNPRGQSSTAAQYKANLRTIVQAALANVGSCILIKPTPQQLSTRDPNNLMPAYRTAIDEVAAEFGCGIFDLQALFVDYATANVAGGYMADDVHLRKRGYARIADLETRALLTV